MIKKREAKIDRYSKSKGRRRDKESKIKRAR
jgi:hypothetical protein